MNADQILILVRGRISVLIMEEFETSQMKTVTALAYAAFLGDLLSQPEFVNASPVVRHETEFLISVLAQV